LLFFALFALRLVVLQVIIYYYGDELAERSSLGVRNALKFRFRFPAYSHTYGV
jgi:hypothetical protein